MSYETNPKKSKKARRVRRPIEVLGVLPKGRGISNYRPNASFCKQDGCVLPRVTGSSRCEKHTGRANLVELTNNI